MNETKLKMSFGILWLALALAFIGCGRSETERAAEEALHQKQDAARAEAVKLFEQLRKEKEGYVADGLVTRMNLLLGEAKLDFGAIGTTDKEVYSYIKAAYAEEAKAALKKLRGFRNKSLPVDAVEAKVAFKLAQSMSGHDLAWFGTSESEIDQIVGLNFLRAGQVQVGRVTPALLREAGIKAAPTPTK